MVERLLPDMRVGVEVGVREGFFSEHILKHTPETFTLYGIDKCMLQRTQKLRDKYKQRWQPNECESPDCATKFPREFFDFIYLDSDHSYEHVKRELQIWWTRLKPGGIISGHDYTNVNNPSEGEYGVVQAVDEFCTQFSLRCYLTGFGKTDKISRHKWERQNSIQIQRMFDKKPHKEFEIPSFYMRKPD